MDFLITDIERLSVVEIDIYSLYIQTMRKHPS